MKKHIFIFLVLVAMLSQAQTYIPLPDSNTVWTMSAHSFQGPIKYAVKGDSVYNSLVYKKYFIVNDTNLANAQFQFFALVRQNTATKRVYGIKNGTTSEKLLYDFNLNVNDTLSVRSLDFAYMNNLKIKVLAKDSVLINSQYRKRIKITGYSFPTFGPEYWTEGIGSSFGIFSGGVSGYQTTHLCFPTLLCYKQNSVLAYINPTCTTCFDIICNGVGLKESSNANSLTLYPNPVTDVLKINFTNSFLTETATIKITDLLGRTILEAELIQQINIKELKPGIYFLQLYNKEKLIAIEKIIKE